MRVWRPALAVMKKWRVAGDEAIMDGFANTRNGPLNSSWGEAKDAFGNNAA
jgi:hypothetical protein